MGTVNGFGTMFYGWRHGKGSSTATKWLTALYIPVMPLSRFSLSPTTDFEREKFAKSKGEVAAALVGYGSRTDTYTIHGRTPLKWSEVLVTYLKTYIGLPILVTWPLLLLYAQRRIFGVHPEWEDASWFTPAIIVFAGVTLINAVVVPMWAIQSARGYKGGLFRRRKAAP